jgi:serine/threonine-protein kinase RsbW
MAAEPPGFHLEGRAELALVDRVLDELDRLWAQVPDVAAEDRTLFGLALSEIATNIAQHSAGTEVVMRITVSVSDKALRAAIVDTAAPATIDWNGVAMPGEESESGRGLALAQTVLDEFHHSADESGNAWVLVRRPSSGAHPSA